MSTPAGTPSTQPPAGPPGPALADAVVSGPVVSGPSAAGETVSASAGCPAGATLVGGGGYLDFAAGGSQPSMRFNGTLPSDAGGAPVTGSGPMTSTWTVRGAAGGQAMTGAQTHAFALCITAGPAFGLQVRAATVAGPFSQANQPVASATATCPSGTTLVGGGGFSETPPSAGANPSLHLIGTFPSSGGQPARSGRADGWTTSADAGGAALTGTTTTSYALCATGLPATTIAATTMAGPVNGLGENRSVTVTCPSGSVLVGGGGLITSTDPAGVQQGIHLRGSFPSDAGGNPLLPSSPTRSWTAIAIDGGQTSPNHATTAFAVCSG